MRPSPPRRRYQGSARVLQNRGGAYASPGAVAPPIGEARAGGRRRGSLRSWFGYAGGADIGPGEAQSRAAGGQTPRNDRLMPSHSACHGRSHRRDTAVPGWTWTVGQFGLCVGAGGADAVITLLGLVVRVRSLGATRRPATVFGRRVARIRAAGRGPGDERCRWSPVRWRGGRAVGRASPGVGWVSRRGGGGLAGSSVGGGSGRPWCRA
jgi:hypothetical protein